MSFRHKKITHKLQFQMLPCAELVFRGFFLIAKAITWCFEETSSLFSLHDRMMQDCLEMRVSSIFLGEEVGRKKESGLDYKLKPTKVFLNVKD